MYIKNSNFAIYLGLALIVGFGLSFAFTSLSDSSMMSGDISKAKNYSAMMEDPEESLLDEKLANDSEFYKATKTTMDVLEERMNTLQALTEKTDSVCAGIEEFEPVIKSINSLHAKSYNTNIAVKAASEAMKDALDGKRTNFEKASTDAYIGYMKITNQLSTGKVFVDKAAEYVEGKDSSEVKDITELAEAWAVYCILDAALNGREDEAGYWRSKADEFSSNNALGATCELIGTATGAFFRNNEKFMSSGSSNPTLNSQEISRNLGFGDFMKNGHDLSFFSQNGGLSNSFNTAFQTAGVGTLLKSNSDLNTDFSKN